jgi:hypothetical protein
VEWFKWWSTWLSSMRPWVQTLVLPKKVGCWESLTFPPFLWEMAGCSVWNEEPPGLTISTGHFSALERNLPAWTLMVVWHLSRSGLSCGFLSWDLLARESVESVESCSSWDGYHHLILLCSYLLTSVNLYLIESPSLQMIVVLKLLADIWKAV